MNTAFAEIGQLAVVGQVPDDLKGSHPADETVALAGRKARRASEPARTHLEELLDFHIYCTDNSIETEVAPAQLVDHGLAAGQEAGQELDVALAESPIDAGRDLSAAVLEAKQLLEQLASAAEVGFESPHLLGHCQHLHLPCFHSSPCYQIVLLLYRQHACPA